MTLHSNLSKELLRCGFSIPQQTVIKSIQEGNTFLEQLKGKCILKISSEKYLHKTELNGLIFNIKNDEDLKNAWNELLKRFPSEKEFLLQQQIERGVELLAGLKFDQTFGHILTVGLGGIFTEILADISIRSCPVNISDVAEMLNELKGKAVLYGARGYVPVNLKRICRTLAYLSQLPEKYPELNELDINPIICSENDDYIVDTLLTINKTNNNLNEKKHRAVKQYFEPFSVAVVGASQNEKKGGYVILYNLIKLGYLGKIFPVNPEYNKILDFKSFPELDKINDEVDLAILIVPREKVLSVMAAGTKAGISSYIICSAGFSDAGKMGLEMEKSLLKFAAKTDVSFMGPNSIGTINTDKSLATSITRLEPMKKGSVSIIGQSGVFSSGFARQFSSELRPAIAKIACLGNKTILDEIDFMNYFMNDPFTSVLGIYLEGLKSGRSFIKTAEKFTAVKPIVILKSGNSESGAEATSSHTGALAINERVFKGIAKQTGLSVVNSMQEMLDTLKAFELLPLTKGNNVAVISISGMGCVLSADYAEKFGFVLPEFSHETKMKINEISPSWAKLRNPVDIWAVIEQFGPQKAFVDITDAFADQSSINIVILLFVLIEEAYFDYETAFKPIIEKHKDKAFLAVRFGGNSQDILQWENAFNNLRIPTYSDPLRAFQALKHLNNYAEFHYNHMIKIEEKYE